MDGDRYELGVKLRREIFGDSYVDQQMSAADPYSRPWQDYVNEFVWGGMLGPTGAAEKDSSLLNLAMLAVLNMPHELELPIRGALEIRERRDQGRDRRGDSLSCDVRGRPERCPGFLGDARGLCGTSGWTAEQTGAPQTTAFAEDAALEKSLRRAKALRENSREQENIRPHHKSKTIFRFCCPRNKSSPRFIARLFGRREYRISVIRYARYDASLAGTAYSLFTRIGDVDPGVTQYIQNISAGRYSRTRGRSASTPRQIRRQATERCCSRNTRHAFARWASSWSRPQKPQALELARSNRDALRVAIVPQWLRSRGRHRSRHRN